MHTIRTLRQSPGSLWSVRVCTISLMVWALVPLSLNLSSKVFVLASQSFVKNFRINLVPLFFVYLSMFIFLLNWKILKRRFCGIIVCWHEIQSRVDFELSQLLLYLCRSFLWHSFGREPGRQPMDLCSRFRNVCLHFRLRHGNKKIYEAF